MIEWSDAQKLALDKDIKGNMLISAGAGSGKTQVLSQKVHDILESKIATPESILVLTFTVAAAFSMKQRIKRNLKENNVPEEVINKIDSAHIQTFDSFANYLVKKYASYLQISETINILDKYILQIKTREFIEQIVEREYEVKSPIFLQTLKSTCIKTDKDFKTIISELYEKISKLEDKDYILENYESLYFNEEKVKKDYSDLIKLCKELFKEAYESMFSINEFDDVTRYDKLNKYMETILEADDNRFCELLSEIEFPSKTRGPTNKEPFDTFKKEIKENIYTKIAPFANFNESIERVFEAKDETLYLISLIKELNDRIFAYKKATNSYTFDDIQKMSIKLFDIPEIAKKIRDSYKFILVDEYQDTSNVQEKFINLISDNNVYMVGDIKQSIYKFRYANCDIFRDKYSLYKSDPSKGTKVDMIDNFRSRNEILTVVNDIFSTLMTLKRGGAEYKEDHIINYGLKKYDSNIFDSNLYGVKVLDYVIVKDNEDKDLEPKIIVNKIIELFKNKTQVFDADTGELRDIKFSDISILMRSKTYFNQYVRVFNDANIPIACETKNSFTEYDSLLVTESILSGINYFRNNMNDKYVLRYIFASIARSYLYSYDDKKVYDLIKSGDFVKDEIIKKCQGIAEFSLNETIENTLNLIISEFGIIKNLYRIPNVTQNLDKIEFLSSMTKNFDSSRLNFSDFADFFAKLNEYKIEFEIEELDKNKNAVQLMTVHKSKGLEWPIVFVSGISGSRNGRSDKTNGRFTKLSGIEYKRMLGSQVRSFYNEYNSFIDKLETTSEEIRLLYVAFTRPRETLYIVCNEEKYDDVTLPCFRRNVFLNLLKNSQTKLPRERGNTDFNIFEGENLVIDIDDKNPEIVEFCRVFEEKVVRRASHKVEENEVNTKLQALLDKGNELHECMETIDFRKLDASHIKNKEYRTIIEKVLSMDVFKNCKSEKFIDAYKEYEFIGDDIHGFVDLFLLFDDHIEIIDYKLKNIDNPAYKIQLKTYKDYLEATFKKPCKTYLISLIDCVIKEIIHD